MGLFCTMWLSNKYRHHCDAVSSSKCRKEEIIFDATRDIRYHCHLKNWEVTRVMEPRPCCDSFPRWRKYAARSGCHALLRGREKWPPSLRISGLSVGTWNSVPVHILLRARVVVDYAVSCRHITMMSRQALLPLIFAGCELKDQSTRTEILRLCTAWDESKPQITVLWGQSPSIKLSYKLGDESGKKCWNFHIATYYVP